jgi:hypothetical protein
MQAWLRLEYNEDFCAADSYQGTACSRAAFVLFEVIGTSETRALPALISLNRQARLLSM